MIKWIKNRWKMLLVVTTVAMLAGLLLPSVQITDNKQATGQWAIELGNKVITLGHVSEAAGSVDYTYDGVADDVQWQAALNALPATGGRLVNVSAVQLNFAATVTRAIPAVVIQGAGRGTYFTNDGGTALFTAGGNNWIFSDLRTDAGSINMGATTGWEWRNVTINTDYYAYRTPVASTGGADWEIPTGRGVTFVVAASDADVQSIAQADYVCDGTADDVEIQTAINALPASGGTVQLTEGNYAIAASIELKDDTTLAGMGNSTILTLNNAVNDTIITNADATPGSRSGISNYRITIRDMYVDGNKSNQGAGADTTWAVGFSTVEDLHIENLYVKDGWTAGIRTEFITRAIIAGNIVDGAGDDGIAINEESWNITVVGNIIINTGNAGKSYGSPNGIEIQDDAKFVTVVGNSIKNSLQDGIEISVHVGKNPPHDISIIGNSIEDAIQDGISIKGTNLIQIWNVTVNGNVINDATIVGIRNEYTNNVVIMGNTIDNTTSFGIYCNLSYDISLSFNVINNAGAEGITIGGTSNLTVNGNVIKDSVGEGILSVDVTGGTISNNTLVGNNKGIRITSSLYLAIADNYINISDFFGIDIVSSSSYLDITGNVLTDNGAALAGSRIGIAVSGDFCTISDNISRDTGTGNQQYGIYVYGGGDSNIIMNNRVGGTTNGMVNSGASNTIRNNVGYVTENSGTATVLNATTSIVVNHGLAATPTRVLVTPTNNPTNAITYWWVDTLTATQFTIHVNADPGATGIIFDWRAVVGEGN